MPLLTDLKWDQTNLLFFDLKEGFPDALVDTVREKYDIAIMFH